MVPDFKSIMADVANVSNSTPIDEIISKVNKDTLFNKFNFLQAMAEIGLVDPKLVQVLSTIELKAGGQGYQLPSVLKELASSAGQQQQVNDLRDRIVTMMNITFIANNIDYKKLASNPYVMKSAGVQLMVVTMVTNQIDIDALFGAINLEPIIKYLLTAEPFTKTFQQILLENVDFNKGLKELKLHTIFANPLADHALLKQMGIPTQLLQILKTLDFDKLLNVINVTEIVAASFDYNPTDNMKFMTDLIDAIDFKRLPKVVNVNKLIDAVLNISSVYKYLAKTGIDPSFLKSLLDDINLDDALKIIDLNKIFKTLSSTNGTSFENLLKLLEIINLNKLLPDIKLREILKLPIMTKLLNQTGVDPELIATIVESVDLNAALKAFNFTNVNLFDFLNVSKLLNTLVQGTDFNVLIKSVDIDKLFAHPMVAKFVEKQFKMPPFLLKMMLKSVDVDKLVKAVDTKEIAKMLTSMLGKNNNEMLKAIERMLNFNKLLETIDFDRFLKDEQVRNFLKKANIDPVILELLSTIGINNILKNLDIGKIIQNALLSPNGTSFGEIMKQIMKNLDLTKILGGVDWNKVIDGAKTGKITSSFLSISCLQDMASLANMSFSNINIMQMMNNPQLQSKFFRTLMSSV